MVLGHWHLNEFGVEKDCMKARMHLLEAADQLAEMVRDDPRRASGVDEPRRPRLLTDDVVLGGGLLGKGT